MDNKRKFDIANSENGTAINNKKLSSSSSLSLHVEDIVLKYSDVCVDIQENNLDKLGRLNEYDMWALNKHCHQYKLPSPILLSIEKANESTTSGLIQLCGDSGLNLILKDEDGDEIDDNELYRKVQCDIFHKSIDLACELNRIETVKCLLKKDNSRYFDSAMSKAVQKGNKDVVELLLNFLKDNLSYYNMPSFYGICKIAVECGFLDILKLLSSDVVNYWSELLPVAAKHGSLNIVQFIIAEQKVTCDVNKRNNFNNLLSLDEALVSAASGGHREIVDLLITTGASKILSAYAEAVSGGHTELSTYLFELKPTNIYMIDHVRDAMVEVAGVGNVVALQNLFDFLLSLCNQSTGLYNEKRIRFANNAISIAAKSGHLDTVVFLLSQGANMFNQTLFYAAEKGHVEIVKVLLAAGATQDNSTFEIAISNGHLSTVQFLLPSVINNKCKSQVETVQFGLIMYQKLRSVIQKGYTQIAKYFIETCKIAVTMELREIAITYGRIEILELLFDIESVSTADLNKLLRHAASRGNLIVIHMLLEKGANDCDGALTHALDARHYDLIEPLVSAGAKRLNDALIFVSKRFILSDDHITTMQDENYTIDVSKFLIERGATKLDTALINAAGNMNITLMRVLIDAGATAFSTALYSLHCIPSQSPKENLNRLKATRYLLQKGANPFVVVSNGTAFMMANDSKIVQLFFEYKEATCSLADQTVIKKSFLQAVQKANYDSIKVYLANGVDANEIFGGGIHIPIICAVEYGARCNIISSKVAKLLLEKGADVNSQTKLGKTALIAAIKTKKPMNIIKLLVESGAHLDLKDYDGKTALFWAAITKSTDQIEKVQYLLDAGADGRELISKKAQDKPMEELILNSQVLELIKSSNDAKPLYYCK